MKELGEQRRYKNEELMFRCILLFEINIREYFPPADEKHALMIKRKLKVISRDEGKFTQSVPCHFGAWWSRFAQ